MKYILISCLLILSSCSTGILNQNEKLSVSVHTNTGMTEFTGSGFLRTQSGFVSTGNVSTILNQRGEINLVPGEDGQYKELVSGYIVHNPESCIYDGPKDVYDWIDYDYSRSKITEAGCFSSEMRNNAQNDYGYHEDENGTYYQDKDGGEYNLRRISKSSGGSPMNDLVATTASGWIIGRVPLYWVHDEVYLYGQALSGVTNPYVLKVLNLEDGDDLAITDGKTVWQYKSIFDGADPNSLKFLSGGLYIDNKSCYIKIPFEIKKLEKCNPRKIRQLTNDPGNWIDTKMYSDDDDLYNAYGDLMKN